MCNSKYCSLLRNHLLVAYLELLVLSQFFFFRVQLTLYQSSIGAVRSNCYQQWTGWELNSRHSGLQWSIRNLHSLYQILIERFDNRRTIDYGTYMPDALPTELPAQYFIIIMSTKDCTLLYCCVAIYYNLFSSFAVYKS